MGAGGCVRATHGGDVGHKGGIDACGGRVCIWHHHHLLLLLVRQGKLGQQRIQVILITWEGRMEEGAWCSRRRGEGSERRAGRVLHSSQGLQHSLLPCASCLMPAALRLLQLPCLPRGTFAALVKRRTC
jgi:hypothetical protein